MSEKKITVKYLTGEVFIDWDSWLNDPRYTAIVKAAKPFLTAVDEESTPEP